MIIRHNQAAQNGIRTLNARQSDLQKTISSLSSGQRIKTAGDDPASYSMSERLKVKTASMVSAKQNSIDGISLIRTADGYLSQVQSLLSTAKSLAIQSASGVPAGEDRVNIQFEVDTLLAEVDRIKGAAQFNGKSLLDGSFTASSDLASDDNTGVANVARPDGEALSLQVGVDPNDSIQISIRVFSLEALGINELNYKTSDTAKQALSSIDKAIDIVNRQRVELGSYQIRLQSVVDTNAVAIENFKAAESDMRDTDIAAALSDLSKQLLSDQLNLAMISQANAKSQAVLRLLQ